jgi:hypothetical protein
MWMGTGMCVATATRTRMLRQLSRERDYARAGGGDCSGAGGCKALAVRVREDGYLGRLVGMRG